MSSKKKQPFMYSIDPDLYKRSHAPSCTIAMGMKPSQASSLCWRDQVTREQTLMDRWRQQYDPEGTQEAQQAAALEKTVERAKARKEAYLSPAANPELHSVLYGSLLAAAPDACGGGNDGNDRGEGGEEGDATLDAQTETETALNAEMQKRKVKPSVKYLEARYDNYSVSQRFPHGPVTSSQVVAWAAAAGTHLDSSTEENKSRRATAELYKPSRQRPALQAYHKPEDDDHALLFGYDFQPK